MGHMSHVTFFFNIFFLKVVKIVIGGYVITEANLFSLHMKHHIKKIPIKSRNRCDFDFINPIGARTFQTC